MKKEGKEELNVLTVIVDKFNRLEGNRLFKKILKENEWKLIPCFIEEIEASYLESVFCSDAESSMHCQYMYFAGDGNLYPVTLKLINTFVILFANNEMVESFKIKSECNSL